MTRFRSHHRLIAGLLVAAVAGALFVGCSDDGDSGGDAGPPRNAFTITGEDFSFAITGEARPGQNDITLVNAGQQEHHAQLIALDEGKTMEDVLAFLASGSEQLPDWAKFAGGPSAVYPGLSAVTTTELHAGNYLVLCFIPDFTDGVPHVAKGMLAAFSVAGEDNGATAPTADVTVNGGDYVFDGPATMTAGETAIAFNNVGAEAHEMAIVQLQGNATLGDYLAALSGEGPAGPPPGFFVGGVQGVEPGASGTAIVTLEAGRYGLLCFFSNAEGAPHFALGMMSEVTVN